MAAAHLLLALLQMVGKRVAELVRQVAQAEAAAVDTTELESPVLAVRTALTAEVSKEARVKERQQENLENPPDGYMLAAEAAVHQRLRILGLAAEAAAQTV